MCLSTVVDTLVPPAENWYSPQNLEAYGSMKVRICTPTQWGRDAGHSDGDSLLTVGHQNSKVYGAGGGEWDVERVSLRVLGPSKRHGVKGSAPRPFGHPFRHHSVLTQLHTFRVSPPPQGNLLHLLRGHDTSTLCRGLLCVRVCVSVSVVCCGCVWGVSGYVFLGGWISLYRRGP